MRSVTITTRGCVGPPFFYPFFNLLRALAGSKNSREVSLFALGREKQSNRTHPGQLNAKRSPIVKNEVEFCLLPAEISEFISEVLPAIWNNGIGIPGEEWKLNVVFEMKVVT